MHFYNNCEIFPYTTFDIDLAHWLLDLPIQLQKKTIFRKSCIYFFNYTKLKLKFRISMHLGMT